MIGIARDNAKQWNKTSIKTISSETVFPKIKKKILKLLKGHTAIISARPNNESYCS